MVNRGEPFALFQADAAPVIVARVGCLLRVPASRGPAGGHERGVAPNHEPRRKGSVMKTLALSGLVLAAALAVGTAQAQPLTLTANQMDGITAGGNGFANFNLTLNKNANLNTNIRFNKFANVQTTVRTFGALADAEAGANCAGYFGGCTAETVTAADSNAFFLTATSASQSVSASY
jgi:hypothetical protein